MQFWKFVGGVALAGVIAVTILAAWVIIPVSVIREVM